MYFTSRPQSDVGADHMSPYHDLEVSLNLSCENICQMQARGKKTCLFFNVSLTLYSRYCLTLCTG